MITKINKTLRKIIKMLLLIKMEINNLIIKTIINKIQTIINSNKTLYKILKMDFLIKMEIS